MGLEPVPVPLFEIVAVPWSAPDPSDFDIVVLTSANAVRHAGAQLAAFTQLECATVGEATAAAARAAGFERVTVGKGDAAALAASMRDSIGTGDAWPRVLHLTGVDHVPFAFDATLAIPVYDSPANALTLPAADIALVHSPRAGARLAELVEDRASLRIVAISAAAAAACGAGWRAMHVADVPREQAMLETLAQVCEAPPQ